MIFSAVLRRLIKFAIALAALTLVSCGGTPVASDLSQSQANQIVSILNQHGIGARASRETGGKARYYVEVKSEHYAQAVSLISQKGLPSEPELTFADLVGGQGLLPASREIEQLKLDHALASEISDVLKAIPQVLNAKVLVRLHSIAKEHPPAVSAVIQERAGETVDIGEITELILKAVPGLDRANIVVSKKVVLGDDSHRAEEGAYNIAGRVVRVPLVPFLAAWRVPENEYNTLALTLLCCFLLIGILGGLMGYWVGFSQVNRNIVETDLPEIRPRALKPAAKLRKDLPES